MKGPHWPRQWHHTSITLKSKDIRTIQSDDVRPYLKRFCHGSAARRGELLLSPLLFFLVFLGKEAVQVCHADQLQDHVTYQRVSYKVTSKQFISLYSTRSATEENAYVIISKKSVDFCIQVYSSIIYLKLQSTTLLSNCFFPPANGEEATWRHEFSQLPSNILTLFPSLLLHVLVSPSSPSLVYTPPAVPAPPSRACRATWRPWPPV